jgi:uncharacterized membrane protein
MPSKYDTNPLDPDFPEKVRAESEGQPTQVLSDDGAASSQQFGRPVMTEDQTRQFPGGMPQFQQQPQLNPQYQQPYNGQYVPMYQQQAFGQPEATDRKVEPFGISENIVTAVPYIPWYIGMVAGAIILFLTPRHETKVRFHAAQGLAAHIGILIVTTLLGILGEVTGAARAGNVIFTLATSIMLVVWAIKAWRGRPVHIQAIEGLTNWLEDKIRQKDK